jgi:abortive infection bacteriophage resistance protein
VPRPFTKPATTIAQQLQHLQAEGMAIPDMPRAEHWLRHVSYYRLSAYWLPFEYPKGNPGPRFLPGTSFDTVTALYDFDRRLRLLVLDAIERIEVAVRGSWAYELAQRFGPHGYLDARLYYHPGKYHDNLTRLTNDVANSPETYIDHYRRTYDTPVMPPVWMVAEMMSFGQLSRWYALLGDRALRNAIAKPLGLPEAVLVPLLKHLSTIRNSCAHHARLWNRGFLLRMRVPSKPAALVNTLEPPAAHAPARLYNALVLIVYLLKRVAPASAWRDELTALLAQHPTGDLSAMGFPLDWDARPLWL